MKTVCHLATLATLCASATLLVGAGPERSVQVAYNQPGVLVDLGVGLWASPMPMDYNHDGLIDLVVACTGKPSNGTYFFENSGRIDPQTKLPIFLPGKVITSTVPYPQVSYVDGKPVVTSPHAIYPDFLQSGFEHPEALPLPAKLKVEEGKIRADQWRLVDFDGDGVRDLIVGIGHWKDYGWDNAYDEKGTWKNGPLHGYVYVLKNTGTDAKPDYADPQPLMAGDQPVDVFGMPSPSFGDFRGTGKLDLICGQFTDGFTFFENIGTRTDPKYAKGRKLTVAGQPLVMDLCMITPMPVDFDGDGIIDLISGDEDGRVALLQGTGKVVDGLPQFLPPRYFRQYADNVKFGALSAPASADLDGDGEEDLIVGDSAGYIGFIKNLGGTPRRWAAPVYLAAGGKVIREQAGVNGSIQGPAEAKWGYTNLSVADWDGDGLLDILSNGIWGRVEWYKNIGTKTAPVFAPAQPIEVAWNGNSQKPSWNWWSPKGNELVTQWRTTPFAIDWNQDGLMDLIMLDSEGYLAFFERHHGDDGKTVLLPPKRIFWGEGASEYDSLGQAVSSNSGLLRMNAKTAGASGRRTFCITDWDGDGVLDLLVNSKPNVNFLKGIGRNKDGLWVFKDQGPVDTRELAGHSTTPTILHWSGSARGDLVIGAEDGFFYYLNNPHRN